MRLIGVLFGILFFFIQCQSTKQENTTPSSENETQVTTQTTQQENTAPDTLTAATLYACPMKCEGDKTYDKPGTCPVCGMDLEPLSIPIESHHDSTNHHF